MVQLSSAQGYVSDSITTASPERLVVMLYDRLILDIDRALIAVEAQNSGAAHDALVHAQDIIAELARTLDPTTWPAGNGLAALYVFVDSLLIDANVQKDPAIVAQCRELLVPLRDAWREAANRGTDAR